MLFAFSGLMVEVMISIGAQQITSIIRARSAREMELLCGAEIYAALASGRG
jgi:molybdopterin-binding protein